MHGKAVVIFLLAFGYAYWRYVVYGPVSADQIPVYILNKAVSVTSLFYLMLASYRLSSKSPYWGQLAFHTAMLHILLTLAIFSKEYYPKFYNEDLLGFAGELVILSGVLSWYCYWLIRRPSISKIQLIQLKWMACGLIAVHVYALGYKGWMTVEDWYGSLPPISLISFALALGCAGILGLDWKRAMFTKATTGMNKNVAESTES